MAWVIIGGLTSSMFLTLLLVPCMYYIIETVKNKVLGILEKKEAKKKTLGSGSLSGGVILGLQGRTGGILTARAALQPQNNASAQTATSE